VPNELHRDPPVYAGTSQVADGAPPQIMEELAGDAGCFARRPV